MYPSAPLDFKLKIFLKETQNAPKTFHCSSLRSPDASWTGNEAKDFYEKIIREPPSRAKPRRKPAPPPAPKPRASTRTFKNSDLLWMAQNDDVETLREFFSANSPLKERNVDIADDFGWTPLMCAACSGAENSVRILLENGADPEKRDRVGNTALSLARQKGATNVVDILTCYGHAGQKDDKPKSEEPPVEVFYCSTCGENVKANRARHDTSTLHLFHSRLKTRTFYGIPETNRGFQLLLRKGWDRDRGLGRDGRGRKFPVKAVMKKDRVGIGAAPVPAAALGEGPKLPQYLNKTMQTFKKQREKILEKNFRLEFS